MTIEKCAAIGRANNEVNGSSMMPAVTCFSEMGSPSARDDMGITNKAPINAMHRVSDINVQAVPIAEGAFCFTGSGLGVAMLKRCSSLIS